MSEFGHSMRRGVVWSTLAFVAAKALSFVALAILARILVPSEFGVVAAILVYLALIELGSDLGMNATVVYEQEGGHGDRIHVAFVLNLVLALLLTGAGVLAAPLIAGFFHLEAHTGLFRLAALNPALAALGNIHDSLLLRDMKFRRRTIALLVRGLVRGTVSVALAVAGLGAASIVIGLLSGTLAWAVTQWVLTPFRPRAVFDRGIARSMAAYGAGAASLEVISLVTTRADAAVVGRVLGAHALGLYTIAFRVPELLIESVAWNVSLVAFPAMSRQRMADRDGLGPATMSLLRWQALYVAPVAAILAVTAPALIVVAFSSQWAAAGAVGSALAVMFGVSAVAFPLGDVYRALGRQRLLAAINVVQLGLIVGSVLVVASQGILAVAWARTGAQAVQAVMVIGFAVRMLRVSPLDVGRAVAPALAAAAGAAGGSLAVRLAWGATSVGSLGAMTAAGVAGAVLVLALTSPQVLRDLRSRAAGLRARGAGREWQGTPTGATP